MEADNEEMEIEVELEKDTLVSLALLAHQKNITLNALIIEFLESYAKEQKQTA